MKVFSGSSNPPLAEKVAKKLATELSPLEIHIFPDGEKGVRVIDRVVEEDCVVVQSASTPADSNYMELFFIVDSLKRSGAKSVIAVVPYLGYQRQDHIFRDGEAVSLQVIIETLQRVGVSKLITFDLHSIKIPELFSIPVIHLSALELFAGKIREISGQPSVAQGNYMLEANKLDAVLVSPDMGGIRRIKILSEMLSSVPFAVIDKNRDLVTGEVSAKEIQGDVKGKRAIIVDDMISTGKTIAKAVELLTKKGAKGILVFATHPVFSKDAKKTLSDLPIEKIYVTDTINVPKEKNFDKLEIISIADLIADNL